MFATTAQKEDSDSGAMSLDVNTALQAIGEGPESGGAAAGNNTQVPESGVSNSAGNRTKVRAQPRAAACIYRPEITSRQRLTLRVAPVRAPPAAQ
jgi:hypothetical protein